MHQSDATSGKAATMRLSLLAGPPAPLACLRAGKPAGLLLHSVAHWPQLPAGFAWGTPTNCGVPPPPLGAATTGSPSSQHPPQAPAQPAPQEMAVRWCPPGALPVPASTYHLLLPEDFSLARPAATRTNGGASAAAGGCGGPLGLRLTITPDLLASVNAAVQVQRQVPALRLPAL